MDMLSPAIAEFMKQGAGYALAVIIGFYCWVLDNRLAKSRTECNSQAEAANKAVQDQYEKRLAEFREILDVMTNSTQTVNATNTSIAITTDAINQLAAGFAKLLHEFQSLATRWDDRGGTMQKQLEDLRLRLEVLQREGRAA